MGLVRRRAPTSDPMLPLQCQAVPAKRVISMNDDVGALQGELHGWLEATWDPRMTLGEWWRQLAESGWGYAHFPADRFGKGVQPAAAGMLSRAIQTFGAVPPPGGFATAMAAPTLIDHGTDDQIRRWLPGLLTGADAFCQLFSEPNAGSDLAGLQCRAEHDGDTWVVNGQKVWTSSAQIANKAMLVARTNVEVPKHAGISYFFIDVRQPGVEIRPLRELTGRAVFNEVFFTDARIPAEDLIGGEGNGWAVANTTLAYERGRRSTGGVSSWASPGPLAGDLERPAGAFTGIRSVAPDFPAPTTAKRLAAVARALGRSSDPVLRQRLARLYSLEQAFALTGQRARDLGAAGGELAGLPNLTKMWSSHLYRESRAVTFDVLGQRGALFGYDESDAEVIEALTGIDGFAELVEVALFAAAPPIYGGSDQIQRNIVGERVLGLAREPGDDRKVPFKDLPKNS